MKTLIFLLNNNFGGVFLISNTLIQTNNKYWIPKDAKAENISFPDEHDSLFEIEESSFWFQHRNQCIMNALKKYPPKGMFYDVGGGNGCVAKAIQNTGYDVTLIEPYEKGAYNAVKRGVETVVCSTLQGSGIPRDSIPAIGIFDVLEHINDDIAFLSDLNSYLVDGGKLYTTVPSYQFLWSEIDKESYHYKRYRLSALKNKLENANFDILYQTYFFALLPIQIYLLRTLPSKLKIKRNEKVTPKEHKQTLLKPITTIYSKIETLILKKMSLPFGGSCLVVAQKRKENN